MGNIAGFNIGSIAPNPLLTDYLFQWQYRYFFAKDILKPAKVDKRTFRVQLLNTGPFRVPDGSTGPRGAVKQVTIDASQKEFTVKDKYLEHPVDRIEAGEATFSMLTAATDFVAKNLNLIHEKDVASLLTTATNVVAGNRFDFSAAPYGKFSDPATDVIGQINAMIAACNAPPNYGWIGWAEYQALAKHDQMMKAVAGLNPFPNVAQPIGGTATGTGMPFAAADRIAAYFGLDALFVGREKYDNSADGATSVPTYIWTGFGVGHIVPQPTPMSVTFAACFSETLADASNFFLPFPGPKGSDYVRAGWNRELVVMDNSLAAIATNVI